jgi:hypothetical protein
VTGSSGKAGANHHRPDRDSHLSLVIDGHSTRDQLVNDGSGGGVNGRHGSRVVADVDTAVGPSIVWEYREERADIGQLISG